MPPHRKGSAVLSPGAFVLDSSMALAWCFPDERPSAQSILDLLATSTAIVPHLWHLEIANALLMGERRKRSQPSDTVQWLNYLRSLPIQAEEMLAPSLWENILTVARTYSLSAYDAAYLELALRRGLPLATLDKDLRKAAKESGVTLYSA